MNPDNCACGQPLHYTNAVLQELVTRLIETTGPYVKVSVGNRSWLVQRHYIALHGIKAKELPYLGFEEITSKT